MTELLPQLLSSPSSLLSSPSSLNDEDKSKLDLCRAVIEYKPHSNRAAGGGGCGGGSGTNNIGRQSLLHVLCSKLNSEQHGRPPVPFDVILATAQLCPHLLSVTANGKKQQTPLHILLDKGAPPEWIKHIVDLDDYEEDDEVDDDHGHCYGYGHHHHPSCGVRRRSMLCTQDYNGDTPLLYAVRRRKDDASELVKILLRKSGDGRRRRSSSQSLLIPSKKGKVPLYYVVHEEMKDYDDDVYLYNDHGYCDDDGGRLPSYLVYLLLATEKAVEEEEEEVEFNDDGRIKKDANLKYDDDGLLPSDDDESSSSSSSWPWCCESDGCCSEDDGNDGNDNDSSRYYYWSRLLHATITCSHFLTERKLSSKLFRIILSHFNPKPEVEDFELTYVDDEQRRNNLVHCMCNSKESKAFLQTFEDNFDGNTSNNDNERNILEAISIRDPNIMERLNSDCLTPLQLAIQKRKAFDFILALIHTAPDSVKNFAADSTHSVMGSPFSSASLAQKNLPLNLMIISWDRKSLVSCSHKQQDQEIARRRFYTNEQILHVYRLYPDALSVADHITKLHPWQLAGLGSCPYADPKVPTKQDQDQDQRKSSKNRSSSRSTSSKDVCGNKPSAMDNGQNSAEVGAANDVSLIYTLLRAAPQALLSDWSDK